MTRLLALLVLGTSGFLFSPNTASAQFGPGYRGYAPNYGFSYGYNGPAILPQLTPLPQLPSLSPLPYLPPLNPYFQPPRYTYQYNTYVQNPYTGAVFTTRNYYSGVVPPAYTYSYPIFYPQSGSYASGDTSVRPNLALQYQSDLMRAQRAMSLPGAYAAGGTTTVGGKPVAGPVIDAGAVPDGFAKALAPADRARVLSGDALNDMLKEIVKAEPKGGNRASAYIPVALLDEVRFGGSDAADAVNLARRAGNLNFPTAFDDPALKELRVALDKDFTAVATALQAGKSPDPAKRAQFEVTLQKVETALGPVVKNLPFEDATTARRFMNQMSNALKAMKAGAGNGLIDPKWAVEGTTTADLVKYMTRNKLQFAAAPAGNEESYTTLHRDLATYLYLLTQPKK